MDIRGLEDGLYTLQLDMTYEGQIEPASSQKDVMIATNVAGIGIIFYVLCSLATILIVVFLVFYRLHDS